MHAAIGRRHADEENWIMLGNSFVVISVLQFHISQAGLNTNAKRFFVGWARFCCPRVALLFHIHSAWAQQRAHPTGLTRKEWAVVVKPANRQQPRSRKRPG
jgi:hypothetical protein